MDEPAPMVRFFGVVDDWSPLGVMSVTFVEALVQMGVAVRVLVANRATALLQPAVVGDRWARLASCFHTPMVTPWVNVICGDLGMWKRLYTVGVKNVLITNDMPGGAPGLEPPTVIIVPTAELGMAWALAGYSPVVVPLAELATAARLRHAVLG